MYQNEDLPTIDNIHTLMSIVTIKLSRKRSKMYDFFVDFSAFDQINRKMLIYKLYNVGLPTKFSKAIQELLNGPMTCV